MDKEANAVIAGEFFLEKEKQAKTGEIIVKVIVVLGYICLFADFIPGIVIGSEWGRVTFSAWGLVLFYSLSILWSVCYYGLYLGRAWAKWVYLISFAPVLFFFIIGLFELIAGGRLSLFLSFSWISVVTMAIRIASCIMLISSKSVREFIV